MTLIIILAFAFMIAHFFIAESNPLKNVCIIIASVLVLVYEFLIFDADFAQILVIIGAIYLLIENAAILSNKK